MRIFRFAISRAMRQAAIATGVLLVPAFASATTVTGRVFDAASDMPVIGAVVSLDDSDDWTNRPQATTGADGRYSLTYTCTSGCGLRTAPDGYLDAYASLTPPTATADIALTREATISGRIILPGGAVPDRYGITFQKSIAGSWGNTGYSSEAILTGGDTYRIVKLPVGTYRVCYADSNVLRQCFDHIDQGPLASFNYTTIPLATGQQRTSVDFAPATGASITGRVYDRYASSNANFALRFTLYVYDQNGQAMPGNSRPAVDAQGNYTLRGIAGGSYYLVGSAGAFRDRIWPSANCPFDCNPQQGSPVTVPTNGVAANIDFGLDPYAVMRARILDATTGSPVARARLANWVDLGTAGPWISTPYGHDAATGEHYAYAAGYFDRIAASAPGYVPRFVEGGDCTNFPSCLTTYPEQIFEIGEVRQAELRLQRIDGHIFADTFD